MLTATAAVVTAYIYRQKRSMKLDTVKEGMPMNNIIHDRNGEHSLYLYFVYNNDQRIGIKLL